MDRFDGLTQEPGHTDHLDFGHAFFLGQWDDCDEKAVLTSDNLDTTIQRLLRALDPKEDSWPLLENDFEGALFTHYPILVKAQSALEKAGCKRVAIGPVVGHGRDPDSDTPVPEF